MKIYAITVRGNISRDINTCRKTQEALATKLNKESNTAKYGVAEIPLINSTHKE